MIGKQLQRDDRGHRRKQPGCIRQPDDMLGNLGQALITIGCQGNHNPAPRLGLFHLTEHLFVPWIVRSNRNDRHMAIDEGDRSMFHLAGWVTFSVNVGYLLEFQSPFIGGGHIHPSSQVDTMAGIKQSLGDIFDLSLPPQALSNQIGDQAQVGNQFLPVRGFQRAP